MRNCEEKEERLMLLESWRDFEKEFGSDGTMERVRKLLPEKVKKRRKLTAEDGVRTRAFHLEQHGDPCEVHFRSKPIIRHQILLLTC